MRANQHAVQECEFFRLVAHGQIGGNDSGKLVSMLGKQELMAFLATRDGRQARAFYEGTLGLPVTADDDFALALDANGIMVRVQKVGAFAPHPFS